MINIKNIILVSVLAFIIFSVFVNANEDGLDVTNLNYPVSRTTNLIECDKILNGDFSLGSMNWNDISEGPGLGSGIVRIIDSFEGHSSTLNMNSIAGGNYYLFWTQTIPTCRILNKALKFDWKLSQIERNYGMAGVYLDFYDSSSNVIGRYVIRRHTGDFSPISCNQYISEHLVDHPNIAVGCEEKIGISLDWESKELIFDEDFFDGLNGVQLNPSDIKSMKIILMSYNNAGSGVNAYFDNFVLKENLFEHEYLYYDGDLTWSEAVNYCSNLGSGWHIITVNNQEEQNYIWSTYGSNIRDIDILIGLRDVNGNGIYEDDEWQYETSIYRNWESGYGTVHGGCIEMYHNKYGRWIDGDCLVKRKVVCERDFIPTPEADFSISSSDIFFSNNSPTKGDTLTITSLLHNLLENDPTQVKVRFYLGNPSNGNIIGEDTVNILGNNDINLVPSSSFIAQIEWVIPIDYSLYPGNYDIYVQIDPYNQITETNEDNNLAFKSINLKTKPNLRVREEDIFFTNNNPSSGEKIMIMSMIRNLEMEPTEKFVVKAYLDGNWVQGLIGNSLIFIDGQDTKVVTFPWIATAGSHDLYIFADFNQTVCELDESNNIAHKTILVSGSQEIPVKILNSKLEKTI